MGRLMRFGVVNVGAALLFSGCGARPPTLIRRIINTTLLLVRTAIGALALQSLGSVPGRV